MTKAISSVINDGGLRYTRKPSGSSFSTANQMRSCFKCGTHRVLPALKNMRFLGRNEKVCLDGCPPK